MSDDLTEPRCADIQAELTQVRSRLHAAERRHADSLERERAVRGELQRQVRNTLALVRSIFTRSVAAGGSLEDLAEHFQGRLDVLARYQLSRAQEQSDAVDLETMVRDELLNFQSSADARVTVEGPELRLGHDAALAVGLALHELMSNSIKFGVLSSADPRAWLRIGWRLAEARLKVLWEEGGIAILASAPLRTGFGREFIEQALPYQLGAETSFQFRPGGLNCAIDLPLVVIAAGPGAKGGG